MQCAAEPSCAAEPNAHEVAIRAGDGFATTDATSPHSERRDAVPPARTKAPARAKLRLFGEEVTDVASGELLTAAVLELEFEYPGGFDPPCGPGRDVTWEREIERLLESHGAIDVACVDDCSFDFSSTANYLLALGDGPGKPSRAVDPSAHKACSFVAHAVPRLCEAGVDVRMDPSFPYPTLSPEVRFHANVQPDESMSWFEVRVGIEVDGKPYNIVPALLDLLTRAQEGSTLESLARFPARYRAIRLDNGRHVVLPWSRLERILSILSEIYPHSEGQALRLPRVRAQALVDLDRALSSETAQVDWQSGREWLEQAQTLVSGPKWSPPPAALRADLRPYQLEGLSWLEHLRDAGAGAVLADDMGLGKTLQTIALLAREKEGRRIDLPCLIVAPTSVVFNWALELKKFAPHLKFITYHGSERSRLREQLPKTDIVITSYHLAIRDAETLEELEFHYLILDEAQTIKNPGSLARLVLARLRARHRIALSGTPVENNLTELWSVMDFALPGLLGSRREFEKRFQTPIEDELDDKRLQELRERIAPFLLRRTKESVAKDLPPKTELTRSVELFGAQRDLYESIRLAADADVRAAIRSQGIQGSAITILDALMKLRQVCCDPRLLQAERAKEVRESAKFEYFLKFLKEQLAQGRRVLVFSQFAKMLVLLEAGLRENGIASLCLHGQTKNRQELVTRFEQGETDVFLISLKAGGTGLNLVSADTVIHYDPWWNAAAQMQATDRAYRIGQKKPVFVYNLIAHGSVEERMLALQAKKRRLADNLLAPEPGALRFSVDDLRDLFAPLSSPEPL